MLLGGLMERNEFLFDTGEVVLHVVAGGAEHRPPMVLLHGATGNWKGWFPVLPRLEQHWHVYAVDMRGHGGSGHAAGVAEYHLSCFARDVAAFLRGYFDEPCLLIGHSWGALSALFAAELAPERVRALVLEDPPMTLRRESTENQQFLDYFHWAYQQKQAAGSRDALMEVLRRENPDMDEDSLSEYADTLYALDENFLRMVGEPSPAPAAGMDFARAIASINCPALLLRASPEKGGTIFDQDLAFFREHARSFEVVEFDTGHGIHSQDPDGFMKVVERVGDK